MDIRQGGHHPYDMRRHYAMDMQRMRHFPMEMGHRHNSMEMGRHHPMDIGQQYDPMGMIHNISPLERARCMRGQRNHPGEIGMG